VVAPIWGIGGSFGGTIKIRPVTLEPFIIGGYQHLSQKGDGKEFNTLGFSSIYDAKLTRSEWFVGGGLSILFNLP
jgi:hypothetical protein